jgi:PTS system galactitol-specific IIA component
MASRQIPFSNNGRPKIDERLILMDLQASTPDMVLSKLSDHLYAHGFVRDSFKDAVLKREHEFPTGLPSPIPVAIPHADSMHNLHSALAVAILREPVDFRIMGTDVETEPVQLVFMLTITDPKSQASWLGQLIELIRQPVLLKEMLSAKDPHQVAEHLRTNLFPVTPVTP